MSEPWEKFRSLCKYYADCVKYSEHSHDYLFPNQLGQTFMLPALPNDWYKNDEEMDIPTTINDKFVRSYLLNASDEEELYIGYPLISGISQNNNEYLCPILMIPASISVRGEGYQTGIKLQIDRMGISINQDWIDYHIPRSDQNAFKRACEQSSDEFGCVDVELLTNYISRRFNLDNFSPNNMLFSVRNTNAVNGILNTAVLFASNKTTYSKNLLKELSIIGNEPDAVLDKTALAYVFRDPPLPNDMLHNQEDKLIPVSFTKRKMNAGQFAAVEECLNHPVTKVIGPPGSGKSFMAVNLIANEVLNGGCVLFTSRNHKAIHAIYDKTPDAIENPDFPLVSFCTTPENPNNADWKKSNDAVKLRVDLFEALDKSNLKHKQISLLKNELFNTKKLFTALSKYRDAESHIERYQYLRDTISLYEYLLSEIDSHIGNLNSNSKDEEKIISLLEEINEALKLRTKLPLALRIKDLFNRDKKILPKRVLKEQLADIVPNLVSPIVSDKTIRIEIKRLISNLKHKLLVKKLEEAEILALKAEESDINYETLKNHVKSSLGDAEKYVQSAYLEKLQKSVESVKEPEYIVDKCKKMEETLLKASPLPFMIHQDKGCKYDSSVELFRDYLKIFPAWATTMLSLRRTSPCLPGVFSLAIIDEASQCDIAPIIPVLYRAERIAIVGDPSQFPPVITLKKQRDNVFRSKYLLDSVELNHFSYVENNAFGVFKHKTFLLNEHFRCADAIAEYFNTQFYNKELSLCCETGRNGKSAISGIKVGVEWVDAIGGDEAEIEGALQYLNDLKNRGFTGSIGVISPLRNLVQKFQSIATKHKKKLPPQLDINSQINTANGFQGGECDVILFLLGLNSDRRHGEEWYITSPDNKYIYNVSVSRAKHLFVAFGDSHKVYESGISYIQKLIPSYTKQENVLIGRGEVRLKSALDAAGIQTTPQYPVGGRFLDLAIPELKIDIEVDGAQWHLDRNGCKKSDDIHRDILLEGMGWKVLRFWHVDVVNNTYGCVERIKAEIEKKAFNA